MLAPSVRYQWIINIIAKEKPTSDLYCIFARVLQKRASIQAVLYCHLVATRVATIDSQGGSRTIWE